MAQRAEFWQDSSSLFVGKKRLWIDVQYLYRRKQTDKSGRISHCSLLQLTKSITDRSKNSIINYLVYTRQLQVQ